MPGSVLEISGAEDLAPMGRSRAAFPKGSGVGMGAVAPSPGRIARGEESPSLPDERWWEDALPMRLLKWDFTARTEVTSPSLPANGAHRAG